MYSVLQANGSRPNNSFNQTQTIVTISKLITPQAMHQCLKYIYTGSVDTKSLTMQVTHHNLTSFYSRTNIVYFGPDNKTLGGDVNLLDQLVYTKYAIRS